MSPHYISGSNIINLFQLSIEKIVIALIMALLIINGEIDLSVASVMGFAACLLAYLTSIGVGMPVAIVVALLGGLAAGCINGLFVAYVGLPSLVVTLAGLIGFRGLARVLLEDRAIGGFPQWFTDLGQKAFLGPLPFALIVFVVVLLAAVAILHLSTFGRKIYVIGNGVDVARYSGVAVARVKFSLFLMSGFVAALAGVLYAARLGSVRGDLAQGFELEIITMVLLGGVSIFGGSGSLLGVFLAILLVLNLRNGMGLANLTGNSQSIVIGVLLILSAAVPFLVSKVRSRVT
ncbi:ABC transporter permease [Kaistia terrae]|uniref:Autoinducer 2 import system permease protein LsrD n=1 Tax=Kaistia terrae TaxID=537017 RepID=A0ABW0Q3G2_9HYPH|nr:ABC transporter permease [Kaistia terrae]MCX5581537.1 ABC transporter permease [Kaistia terrae]